MIRLQADMIPGLTPKVPADSTLVKAANEIAELKTLSFDDLIERLTQSAITFAINLAVAVLVFYLGRFVIRKIYRLVSTIFVKRKVDTSLATFILSLVNIVLYFILIVTVIGILGIETTSFLAIFASAGVAIGMALSGTLQNFAGGVLILLLKPYKIGDYIEVQGYGGTVREIQIFHTIITTYDNKSISIPNGGLSTGSVNNWSREAYRRVTWTVSISYGDSVDVARDTILAMFASDERIEDARPSDQTGIQVVGDDGNAALTMASEIHTNVGDTVEFHPEEEAVEDDISPEPVRKRTLLDRILRRHRAAKAAILERERKREDALKLLIPKPDHTPKVVVDKLGDSSVDLQVRAWTRTAEYWNVFYYYNEKFYNELPRHGINFPFPQMDVHLDH